VTLIKLHEVFGGLLGRVRVDRRDDDAGALIGKPLPVRPPEPVAAASDDCHSPAQPTGRDHVNGC
jgi:hypothetical protein